MMNYVMTADSTDTNDNVIRKMQDSLESEASNSRADIKMTAEGVSVFYGAEQALDDINIDIHSKQITALIGPSGCGKTTFLRCLNRMNDVIDGCRVNGRISLDGEDIYAPSVDVVSLRSHVGMVFQKPNPFPKSIFENVAYGPKIHGYAQTHDEVEEIAVRSLKKAGLFEEVKDRLHAPATGLSGGQQQRLCIARAISINPGMLLMDEPCSALDPIATARIEDLMWELKENITIIIVTHSMQQASRVSQQTGFFHMGVMAEVGPTEQIFQNPVDQRTRDYITGRFG